ncbi:AAA family ATPase [Lentzea albidocapillata]|nr:AAA family ATPase [Lentzea albidocapillata]
MSVEEGFLDGLDITFSPGLNVIIGARGVGKTSVLELIRYALRLPHIDERRAADARRHAESVLGGGRVTVTYSIGQEFYSSSRSMADPPVDLGVAISLTPMSLGQNELEGIGLDQRSRLRLLDGQAGLSDATYSEEIRTLRSSVASMSEQLTELTSQRERLRQQELSRHALVKQLDEARAAEARLMSDGGAELSKLRKSLLIEQDRIATERHRLNDLTFTYEALTGIDNEIGRVVRAIAAVRAEMKEREVPATHVGYLDILARFQNDATRQLAASVEEISERMVMHQRAITEINDRARPLRQEFDRIQQGAGAAAQLTAQLQQQLNTLDVALGRLRKLERRIEDLRHERAETLGRIDSLRERIWLERSKAASRLSKLFAPRIRVALEHYGDRNEYVALLADALRESGLQHNKTADHLSERLSPQELINAIERRDVARLTSVGQLTSTRADKLITHMLGSSKLGSVITAEVDDTVDFELLVGGEYRSTEQLSTGQRCSVVLPILLADSDRTLLLDQPEDHLDNAYLVANTVERLRSRSKIAQTIVVTHNANIPVLGDAEMVIALESDGRRGYVKESGPLAESEVIEAITNLMEGGRDAFSKRAAFYGRL